MTDAEPDSEIFEYAIAREIEAYHFYTALAQRVDNPQISKVFEELAEEELEHKAKLELEVLKTGRTLAPPKEIIKEHEYIISNDPSAPLEIDYKDILLLGMEKEDAAFRTYVNMLAAVSDPESREMLLALAQEEVKHKIRFEIEYDLLLKK